MANFGISIIICVYNGAGRIIPTLKALSEQNIPADLLCELLIVDNTSTDNTSVIAKNYWISVNSPFPITILTESRPGKANALVKGYNTARYELMILVDDDNWLNPDYIKTVTEIYTRHPNIGLLGGYGRALFEPEKQPNWFKTWETCYACGNIHEQNGFLKPNDFSIWGAGSVLRKTMWVSLITNGFKFYNSVSGGKAITEDTELSMAITFTGHQLYFDDRLWFTHDLRGSRITWNNLLTQQSMNGKGNAILYMYRLTFNQTSNQQIFWPFSKIIMKLSWRSFKSFLKPNNRPRWIFFYNILFEISSNRKKYIKLAKYSSEWIKSVRNTFPLEAK